MNFENTKVFNFEGALRGMRNPKESWDRYDSCEKDGVVIIGPNDLKLAQTLIRSGSEHRKFMRQIFVSVDITGGIFWWKEFDTYKVGTVANSTSTMHKLATTPITLDCFEFDKDLKDVVYDTEYFDNIGEKYQSNFAVQYFIGEEFELFVDVLEKIRLKYLETKDKRYWRALIQMLPESWLQKRTVTMNYENLLNMCSKGQRRFHKLTEWSEDFISWARTLPYAQELIFIDELDVDK